MRYNEQVNTNRPEKEPKKREVPLSTPGKTTSEQLISSKNRPFLGGNYNGSSK